MQNVSKEMLMARLRLLQEYLTCDQRHEVALRDALAIPDVELSAKLAAAGVDCKTTDRLINR